MGCDLGLRPGELHNLLWRHVSLPADRLDAFSSHVFASIPTPKVSWAGARGQSGRGGCPCLIEFISVLKNFRNPSSSELVVGGSENWFRGRFKTLVGDSRLPYGESVRPKGVVEASMRASFASSLFESSGDLPLVAWRLRVKNIDTLSHYIHELQAQTFLSLQSEDTRCQIRSLATIAPQVISVSVHFLRSGVSPSLWPRLWASRHFN